MLRSDAKIVGAQDVRELLDEVIAETRHGGRFCKDAGYEYEDYAVGVALEVAVKSTDARAALVQVMREWVTREASDDHFIAVSIAQGCGLGEIKADLEQFRDNLRDGSIAHCFKAPALMLAGTYADKVQVAIDAL